MVAAQAELTQPPFDMPVAESELVAGYMVEYTGFRFLFFFIGEFGTVFAFAALAATLFLGGWAVPWVHGTAADILGPIVLFAKVMFVAFLMFWARFTYPRFREDQLQAHRVEVAHPDRAGQHPHDRVSEGGVLMGAEPMKREIKGMLGGSRRDVPHDDEAGGHRAVPARAGRPGAACAGRHRAEGGELHGLHAVRALVPRLVHLHRGPQGTAPAPP